MPTEASPTTVRDYLHKHYGVPYNEAEAMVAKHAGIVRDAAMLRSFAYYPADKIAQAEGLEELDIEEESNE